MSNSGFSWWAAAYIDKIKGGYVVCPNLWWNKISVDNTNIYLDEWIVIDKKNLRTKIQSSQHEYLNKPLSNLIAFKHSIK